MWVTEITRRYSRGKARVRYLFLPGLNTWDLAESTATVGATYVSTFRGQEAAVIYSHGANWQVIKDEVK